MTEQTIQEEEKMFHEEWVVKALGVNDYEHFQRFKYNAFNGMLIFGDTFIEALGLALSEASDTNAVKIIRTFKNECAVHEMLYKMHEAREKALNKMSALT